jgi:tol-pal system beta propeller repeat protein TolB
LIALVAGTALPATAAKDDGSILFERGTGSQRELWLMATDGSNQRQLTNDKIEDAFPAASPNGKKIAWTRGGHEPFGEIWVMNFDGTDQRQLTFNQASDFGASWSPDGSKIAFRSSRDGQNEIYVINADGSGERRVTNHPAWDFQPEWSPDGSRIAFTSDRSDFTFGIYTMNAADGSDVQQLTPDALIAASPKWSWTLNRLVFSEDNACGICGESDLWTINPDGSGLTQVTNTPEGEYAGGWSRDGTRVVVDYASFSPVGHRSKNDIAIVTVATGAAANLTNSNGDQEEHSSWVK